MRCPFCPPLHSNNRETPVRVLETRLVKGESPALDIVWRRRGCKNGHRYWTEEKIGAPPPKVHELAKQPS